jgi:hypothetical protein
MYTLKHLKEDTTQPFRIISDSKLKKMSQDELISHHKELNSLKDDGDHKTNNRLNNHMFRVASYINDENLHKINEGVLNKITGAIVAGSILAAGHGISTAKINAPNKLADMKQKHELKVKANLAKVQAPMAKSVDI